MNHILGLLVMLSSVSAAGEYFGASSKPEKVFTAYGETEGVTAAPDGTIYFSDITLSKAVRDERGVTQGGHIWRFDPKTGRTTLFRSPSNKSNGLEFAPDGSLIACEGADFGGRRLSRTDMKTGLCYILTATYEGKPYNAPNDLAVDSAGRVFFTDPKYVGPESVEQPVMGVYRHDPKDGSTQRIITDAGKPNGIALSPDGSQLYVGVNDNGSEGVDSLLDAQGKPPALRRGFMGILAYELMDGEVRSAARVLVDYGQQNGPDGMVCDASGNLVVTARAEDAPGLRVYEASSGKEVDRLVMEHAPTNVSFGKGDDSRNLYVTAGNGLYRIGRSN
ncbi:MAG: SMP-30/gluconolactonase/LRE family protein [Verrucomicrobiaceae bacterium]|nr:SMP-30/gluconolactonase/LRE family protein [Verrucomicrobiaceae bacterium]